MIHRKIIHWVKHQLGVDSQFLLPLGPLQKKYRMKIYGAIVVGAHEFREEQEYRKIGVDKFILVEPAEKAYLHLVKKFMHTSTKDVVILHSALGAKSDNAFLRVETENDGQSNSLLDPGTHLELHPNITFGSYEKVRVIRLDDIFQPGRGPHNFLSIDVQGYELEVLKGATHSLLQIDYIHCEVNIDEVYKGCATMGQVDNFLFKHGFLRRETKLHKSGAYGEAFYTR